MFLKLILSLRTVFELNIAVGTGDNVYKSNYSSLCRDYLLPIRIMESWDDQVEVRHVIISGILQVKEGFWIITILFYAIFQSLNSFVSNSKNSFRFF